MTAIAVAFVEADGHRIGRAIAKRCQRAGAHGGAYMAGVEAPHRAIREQPGGRIAADADLVDQHDRCESGKQGRKHTDLPSVDERALSSASNLARRSLVTAVIFCALLLRQTFRRCDAALHSHHALGPGLAVPASKPAQNQRACDARQRARNRVGPRLELLDVATR
jgi:hypothetical protein